MENSHRSKFTVRELEVKTGYFDTEGIKDFSTAKGDTKPPWSSTQNDTKTKYVELTAPSFGQRPQPAQTVDVFMKFAATYDKDQPNIWSYTMMRKPDRNTPCQTME